MSNLLTFLFKQLWSLLRRSGSKNANRAEQELQLDLELQPPRELHLDLNIPVPSASPEPAPSVAPATEAPRGSWRARIKHPRAMRDAFILKEILSRPAGVRGHRPR